MLRSRLVAAAFAACLLIPGVASAQWPWYGPIAGGYGGYDNGLVYPFFYRVRSIPTPPYFSLNPPVYYGPRLLYRPYGNSPFPYPSWYERQFDNLPQPTIAPPSPPQLIVNPYVGQPEKQQETAVQPSYLTAIENPHVSAR